MIRGGRTIRSATGRREPLSREPLLREPPSRLTYKKGW